LNMPFLSSNKKIPLEISSEPPSWEDLAAQLGEHKKEEPLLTLYRDTNGWCPFCERVWVAVEAKQIPYTERLINLRDKPEWYKELVPTTLVPAVLFHGDASSNERKIIWESLDVMKALDEAFPDTPKLILDSPEYKDAAELQSEVSSAGFGFAFASRNESLTDDGKLKRREEFNSALNTLDAALASSGGPFRLGENFTGIDAIMIPTMERWRYQLPITVEFDIMAGRPFIQKWFAAMDDFAPYSERIAGDQYSWTATAAQFLRYFGGGVDKPEVTAAIVRAEAAAKALTNTFCQVEGTPNKVTAKEAAIKLVSNHDAVVKDCTRQDPISQQTINRATDEMVADKLMRYVTSILLSDDAFDSARRAPLLNVDASERADAAAAARTVAARLCVPRDMGGPAAKILRGTLAIIANRLDAV
jgi:glutathione S-transferase